VVVEEGHGFEGGGDGGAAMGWAGGSILIIYESSTSFVLFPLVCLSLLAWCLLMLFFASASAIHSCSAPKSCVCVCMRVSGLLLVTRPLLSIREEKFRLVSRVFYEYFYARHLFPFLY
jgi:hypothetical protein